MFFVTTLAVEHLQASETKNKMYVLVFIRAAYEFKLENVKWWGFLAHICLCRVMVTSGM